MQKLERAVVTPEEQQRILDGYYQKWDEPGGKEYFATFGITSREKIAEIVQESVDAEIWRNDLYQVTVYRRDPPVDDWPQVIHLSIRRVDRQPARDWRDFQDIKNQLVGPECEGVELYPAESRCVDLANQYHMWVFNSTDARFPFGFAEGRHVDDIEIAGSKQRKTTS
jgi:hypothetical protein